MKILITGSAGFLGQWLVPDLQSVGHQITGIDLIRESISEEFILHDLNSPILWKGERYDVCIHLASAVGGFLFNAHSTNLLETEMQILKNIREYCARSDCHRIIYTSSINVFEVSGMGSETFLNSLDQRTPYAQAKAQAEKWIESEFANYTILRPTNYFGADQARRLNRIGESHVIPDLIYKIKNHSDVEILGDGNQIRNFIHISDVSRLILSTLSNSGSNFINLRSDIFLSIKELAVQLMDWLQIKKEIRFAPEFLRYEPFPVYPFLMKEAFRLGWKPAVHSLSDGLALRYRTNINPAAMKIENNTPTLRLKF